ncbi:MAG: transcriptional repressor [Betaproteobacteria bacterium]|nr:transcriptional repressor [Betaproteobacteria bacterium]
MSDATALLHKAGLKATPARLRVLHLLQEAVRPVSHAEIETLLERQDGARLDRVTLYRVLDALALSELVMKAVDARGVTRFSASSGQRTHTGHIHFRCTDCGGVFCLADAPPPPPRLPDGFTLAAVDLDVRGRCAACHR